MAFLSKVGKIFSQSSASRIGSISQPSQLSIFQAIRFMSSSKVFVGGLSYGTDDHSLREAFTKYGEVVEARVILDRDTGRSRGFGFVTFVGNEEASSAIQALDGQDLHGRRIRVNFATERSRGSFVGGGGYSGGGGGYSGGGGIGSADYNRSSASQGGDNYFSADSGSDFTSNHQSGGGLDSGDNTRDDFLGGGKSGDEDNNDDYAKRA
ncbi:Glycine-rich RNA-binding protein 3, mitochondrial [Cucurbita argyrosperma subsp. argyrosperma]|uniref:Glycine-rich RNA-binding protein 4, mitochondrial-like n=1 Tax=Cucurbita moschata TaxID=3662 RepID=A0A6J1GRM7_CUCMO|nr:glycine-rich RNA-binding protein 4, mitochondrial-like [Cucurbita moschata]KAG7012092.1 Glycine-rich RNA-binding protein 3, mitochondrial [Cucurbita argyrosperma subsp. argyrosperma]